jgi:hypothetical protein
VYSRYPIFQNLPNKDIPMVSNKSLIKQSDLHTGQEPTNKIPRRGLLGGAMAALLASPLRGEAQGAHVPPREDIFILLLTGLYQAVPAGQGPADNLGLKTVNLNDGSWSKVNAYPVYGLPESRAVGLAIGACYVSLATFQVAYDLPGGAMVQQFAPTAAFQAIVPDGRGGQYNEGTFALPVLEANGVYADFLGGHNHMVDRMHQLVQGPVFAGFPAAGYDEHCFCMISKYQFPV